MLMMPFISFVLLAALTVTVVSIFFLEVDVDASFSRARSKTTRGILKGPR